MDDDSDNLASRDGISLHAGFLGAAVEHHQPERRFAFDLNRLLIPHPSSTYLFRISGHTWADQGVYDGDVAIVDRALQPTSINQLVIKSGGGGFSLCRRLDCLPAEEVWGVITALIHQNR